MLIGVLDDAQRKLSGSKFDLAKTEGILYYSSGRISNGTGKSGSGKSYGTGNMIGVCLDFDAKTVSFTLNGRPSGSPIALRSTSYAPGKLYLWLLGVLKVRAFWRLWQQHARKGLALLQA